MPHIQMYTSAICGYCTAAKRLLQHHGLDFEEIRIDLEPGRRGEMFERARRTSVPQVFIDGRHVGGFAELAALARAGGLPQPQES